MPSKKITKQVGLDPQIVDQLVPFANELRLIGNTDYANNGEPYVYPSTAANAILGATLRQGEPMFTGTEEFVETSKSNPVAARLWCDLATLQDNIQQGDCTWISVGLLASKGREVSAYYVATDRGVDILAGTGSTRVIVALLRAGIELMDQYGTVKHFWLATANVDEAIAAIQRIRRIVAEVSVAT